MLLALTTLISSLTFSCPPAITTQQQVAESGPAGWKAVARDSGGNPVSLVQNALERLSLFDGEPGELADLKPDNGDSEHEAAYWSQLDGSQLYLVCHYRGTEVTLQQPLPAAIASCQVKQRDPFHITGLRCQQTAPHSQTPNR